MLESLFINFEIIAAFIAALFVYRDKHFYLVAAAILIICFTPDSFLSSPYRTFNTFCLICLVFITLSFVLFLSKKYLPSIALLLISIYCAIFATDTWVNSNEKTWIFNNHEHIIVGLYAIILLSFSKRLSAMVVTCANYIGDIHVNIKFNPTNNPSYKRRKGEAQDR